MHGHAAITDAEGTHTHVGHGTVERKDDEGNPLPDLINCRTMRKIRRRVNIIIGPLMDEWQSNPAAVVPVFGRWFSPSYAIAKVDPEDRYSAVNVTNNNTIEYRIPRFRTAAQYRHCLKLCSELTKTIVTNYCQYANDVYTTPTKLNHKAEITAWNWKDASGETDSEVAARVW